MSSLIWLGVRDLEARGHGERSTIYRRYKRGEYPPPRYFGNKRVWRLDEIEAWEQAQIARSADERLGARNLKGSAADAR